MILPVPQSAYSQAVKVKGGTLVFLSGVGPADENGVLAAPGDFPGQVRATWKNMRRVLATAGGSVDDIVTMTVYTTERRWGEIFRASWRDPRLREEARPGIQMQRRV
jgi:2-iminobutanoate/2-iminopropanoate deaminase